MTNNKLIENSKSDCECQRQKYCISKLLFDLKQLKKDPERLRHALDYKYYGEEELKDIIEILLWWE